MRNTMKKDKSDTTMDELVALCKRRGFIFPASEIYGGINGFWDYGPLGTELKNNLRDRWWHDMVRCPPIGPDGVPLEIVGVDTSIIQNPKAWVASGHVGGFSDPMVDCRACKARFREDHVADSQCPRKPSKRPGEHGECDLTEPKEFNLMFQTFVGATSGEENVAYLRPETAQGIFLNYKSVLDTMRVKMPFGIAQVGKSFRNEVTPRNYIFRSREFEQMEMEWFCPPEDAKMWYDFWVETRFNWWVSLGINPDNLIKREHDSDELAHYSTACADVEYKYPFTAPNYGELEGIAHRGCYDLTQHQEHSGSKMEFFDQEANTKYIPHVIEPASGLTRGVLVLLCEAYKEEWVGKGENPQILPAIAGEQVPEGFEKRGVMSFHPRMAPIKTAVFPLLKNRPELVEKARGIYNQVNRRYASAWDVTGAIGRRYRRQDEVGTPYCITIDFDSLEDGTVTLRDRDTMKQERIHESELMAVLAEKLEL